MRSSGPSRVPPALAGLRRRLTLMYALAFTVGLVSLAGIAIDQDARLRESRADERLLGLASRAASIVDDARTPVDFRPIADDTIDEQARWQAWAVMGEDGDLEPVAGTVLTGAGPLARQASQDAAEEGSFGDVSDGGVRLRAAAMPWFDGDEVGGAVLVAQARDGDPDHPRFVAVVLAATVALVVAASAAGWWLAGRTIVPVARSLERQEQLLSATAHDLRTPVSRVRAVTDVAALLADSLHSGAHSNTGAETTDHDDVLAELRRELARLRLLGVETSAVVEDLLAVARLDAGRLELDGRPVRWDELATTVATAHPGVHVDVPEGLSSNGDEALLRRVVENAVSNAERHGSIGNVPPTIWIEGAFVTGVERGGDRGGGVRIRIRDDGQGIDEATLPYLFERYRSGKRGGSGVGLWLARWVVEAHGGTVTAHNDGGAVITIVLPSRPPGSGRHAS